MGGESETLASAAESWTYSECGPWRGTEEPRPRNANYTSSQLWPEVQRRRQIGANALPLCLNVLYCLLHCL